MELQSLLDKAELIDPMYNASKKRKRIGWMQRNRKLARKRKQDVQCQQMLAQLQTYNSSGMARTADHVIPCPGVSPKRQRGQGRWKSWTPEALLRVAFTPSTSTHRNMILSVSPGGSHAHAANARKVVAQVYIQHQLQQLRSLSMAGKPLHFMIWGQMWDETALPLVMPGFGNKPRPVSVLAKHAQITWKGSFQDVAHEEDVVQAPVAMHDKSAASMLGGLHPSKKHVSSFPVILRTLK